MKSFFKNCDLTITPSVAPSLFRKVNAFNVRVQCCPSFDGTKEALMQEVCAILSNATNGNTEIRTKFVLSDVSFENFHLQEIVFQVITPLEPLWYE